MQLNSDNIADWHPNHMQESIKSNCVKEINADKQEVIFCVVLCFFNEILWLFKSSNILCTRLQRL